MSSSTLYSDGQHPNSAGALILGTPSANTIAHLVPERKITDNIAPDTNYIVNGCLFSGTTGDKNGTVTYNSSPTGLKNIFGLFVSNDNILSLPLGKYQMRTPATLLPAST